MSASDMILGNAFVRIGAKWPGMDSDLKALEAQLVTRVNEISNGLLKAGGVIAGFGAAITGGLGYAAHEFATLGETSLRTSRMVGLSVESILQLEHAARLSESSLGDVTSGLRFLNRNISEAGNGSKEAVSKFEKVGLTWKELKGLAPEIMLEKVSDAFTKITDPSERGAAAMALFGRGGLAMLPFLSQGSKGINTLREDAEKLHYTMSAKNVDSADALGDAWQRLSSAANGLSIIVGSQVAPTLKQTVDLTTELIARFGDMLKYMPEASVAALGAGKAISGIGGALTSVGLALFGLRQVSTTLNTLFGKSLTTSLTGGVLIAIKGMIVALEAFIVFELTTALRRWFVNAKFEVGGFWAWLQGKIRTEGDIADKQMEELNTSPEAMANQDYYKRNVAPVAASVAAAVIPPEEAQKKAMAERTSALNLIRDQEKTGADRRKAWYEQAAIDSKDFYAEELASIWKVRDAELSVLLLKKEQAKTTDEMAIVDGEIALAKQSAVNQENAVYASMSNEYRKIFATQEKSRNEVEKIRIQGELDAINQTDTLTTLEEINSHYVRRVQLQKELADATMHQLLAEKNSTTGAAKAEAEARIEAETVKQAGAEDTLDRERQQAREQKITELAEKQKSAGNLVHQFVLSLLDGEERKKAEVLEKEKNAREEFFAATKDLPEQAGLWESFDKFMNKWRENATKDTSLTSAGTFSAAGAHLLGGGGSNAMERTANNTKKLIDQGQALLEAVKSSGLAYQ